MRRVLLVLGAVVTAGSVAWGVITTAKDPEAAIGPAMNDHKTLTLVLLASGTAGIFLMVAAIALSDRAWGRIGALLGKNETDPRVAQVRAAIGEFVSNGRLLIIRSVASANPLPAGQSHVEDDRAAREWLKSWDRYMKKNIATRSFAGWMLEGAPANIAQLTFLDSMRFWIDGLDRAASRLQPGDVRRVPITDTQLDQIELMHELEDFHKNRPWRLPDEPTPPRP